MCNEGDNMREEISKRITKFFHDFSNVDATVIDIKPEGDEMKVLCGLPDGEYQVTLNKDLSVRAFYRKKPYVMETAREEQTVSHLPDIAYESSKNDAKKPASKPVKRPILSNSEKAVLMIIKEHPGLTSYEIRQHIDIKFTMLMPILKKLLDLNIIQKQNDKYFPL